MVEQNYVVNMYLLYVSIEGALKNAYDSFSMNCSVQLFAQICNISWTLIIHFLIYRLSKHESNIK